METLRRSLRVEGDGPVVMVDDSDDDYFLADRMFARSKLENEFVHCPSAEALVTYLEDRRTAGESMPALILMDINLPGLSGLEATELLRARPQFAVIPVVALLSSTINGPDRRAAVAAGVDGCFVKPMELSAYVDLFNSLAD